MKNLLAPDLSWGEAFFEVSGQTIRADARHQPSEASGMASASLRLIHGSRLRDAQCLEDTTELRRMSLTQIPHDGLSAWMQPILSTVGLTFSRDDVYDASVQKAPSLPDALKIAFHEDRSLRPMRPDCTLIVERLENCRD